MIMYRKRGIVKPNSISTWLSPMEAVFLPNGRIMAHMCGSRRFPLFVLHLLRMPEIRRRECIAPGSTPKGIPDARSPRGKRRGFLRQRKKVAEAGAVAVFGYPL